MTSRRDQLHSYQFMMHRVVSALVVRETDPLRSPLRRGVGAFFAGTMAAVLFAAGFGVYGLLTKVGGSNWKVDGAVVIEQETGASYVYLGGRLHPALNYTSARLFANRAGVAVFRVAANSLAGVPRDAVVGIPGAPGSLPEAQRTIGLPWTLCSQSDQGGAGAAVTVRLIVGSAPDPVSAAQDAALLVQDASAGAAAGTYLVWHGHRYAVLSPQTVVPALFGATVRPVPVGTAWLNALPAGVDIGPLPVEAHRAAPAVPGHAVGDLLVASTGAGPQYYLVFADGLAPLTPLQHDILLAQTVTQPVPVPLAEAAAAPRSARLPPPRADIAPPVNRPGLVPSTTPGSVCARFTGVAQPPAVLVSGAVPDGTTAGGTSTGVTLDAVVVPPGRIAVVRAVPSPDAAIGTYELVTDLGLRYAVPAPAVLSVLGYDPARAVDVPAVLVALIPAGPTLDPAAMQAATPAATAAAGD